jgi:hypothetical protein
VEIENPFNKETKGKVSAPCRMIRSSRLPLRLSHSLCDERVARYGGIRSELEHF